MNQINFRKVFLSLVLTLISSLSAFSQKALWVGESYTFDVTSDVMGLTANLSWSTNGGYLSLSGSGFYRTITVTKYFSGTATVTCEWDYNLTGNGSYTHMRRDIKISCLDNQVSILPSSLVLAPGEESYVSCSHQFDNAYTYAANPYYQSSDQSVVRVDAQTGKVTALSPGSAYINVYSKISSVSPYCKVKVEKVEPISISIPSDLTMTGGESLTITPTIKPSNAQPTLHWSSSDTQIAEVDNSGQITALKEGETNITVSTDNGLSSTCKLSVKKGKLKVFSDTPSGWVEKNTLVTLSSNRPNATIYYTLDESSPTLFSNIYSSPLSIDQDVVINAYAVAEGFYDSDIETFIYQVRDFSVQETYPIDGQTVNKFAIPFITFNQPFHKGVNFPEISLTDSKGVEIPCSSYIGNNQLFVCPLIELADYTGYHVNIPENSVVSEKQETNCNISYSFNTGSKIVRISYGYDNAAIVKSDGSLWCWGQSRFGQLGNGQAGTQIVKEPVKILDDVIDVEMSGQRGMALKSDGSVWCWGRNDSGLLGIGNKQNQTQPVKVLSNISKIYCGEVTSAAISTENDLYMWGGNYYGQIGDGSYNTAISPKIILSNVTDVAVRHDHTAAIVDGTTIYAWGSNLHDQILPYGISGNTDANVLKPFKFREYSGSAVATTYSNTIVLSDGTVNICGRNYEGVFGNGVKEAYVAQAFVQPISNIAKIKASNYYVLALDNDNTLWGWGDNDNGQIGTGNLSDVYTPQQIISDVEYFTAGSGNAAAILSNGDVYAWGKNQEFQLFGASTSSIESTPTKIFDGPKDKNIDTAKLISPYSIIAPEMSAIVAPIIEPSDATISTIQWTSSNSAVASVDNKGIVTGLTEGQVEITAIITDKNGNDRKCSYEFIVDKKAGLTDLRTNDKHRIYSHGSNIIVEFEYNSDNTIRIFDVTGKLISLRNGHNIREVFTGLTSGIYLVEINGQTEKVLCQ